MDGKKEQADINEHDQLRATDDSGNNEGKKANVDYPDEKTKTTENEQPPEKDHSRHDEGKNETIDYQDAKTKTNETEQPPATVPSSNNECQNDNGVSPQNTTRANPPARVHQRLPLPRPQDRR